MSRYAPGAQATILGTGFEFRAGVPFLEIDAGVGYGAAKAVSHCHRPGQVEAITNLHSL
jgi:hypothetical protein